MRARLVSLWLLLMLAAGLALAKPAGAASSPKPQGITVSPAIRLVTLTGAASQPITFTITNNEPVAQSLSLSAANFNTLNESGGLFFVGTNPRDLQKKYGLAKWLQLPQTHLNLAGHQSLKIQANVLNSSDLAPGGHYGALMLSLDGASASQQVGLRPIASALLFVTKPQGATYDLRLTGVTYHRSLFKLPDSLTLRFLDFGNTHLVPRGSVSLNGPSGALVKKGIINENSSIILPQTYRQYPLKLQPLAASARPGHYKLTVSYRFDGYDNFRVYQASFWLAPWWLLAVFAGVTLVLIALAVVYQIRRPKRQKTKKTKATAGRKIPVKFQ